ncbi:MAG: hypothetical protein Q7R49_03065 [Candidatus Daviesbacteria bacterium]|nr:hypothetical protein [Candidatus Daviesbacteria bacterium]
MERTSDRFLTVIGVASALLMTACSGEQNSPVVVTPLPKALPAATIAPTPVDALLPPSNSESKRLGALLENPIDQTHDFTIRRGLGEVVGNNTLQVESNKYELWVNTPGFRYWIGETKADRLPIFSTLTTFNDISSDSNESKLAFVIHPQPSVSVTNIYLDNVVREAQSLLDRGAYQVSPAKRAVAEANLVDLIVNTAIIDGYLGGVNVSESIRRIGPNSIIQGGLIGQARFDASSYQSDLLEGKRPWMVHLRYTRTLPPV